MSCFSKYVFFFAKASLFKKAAIVIFKKMEANCLQNEYKELQSPSNKINPMFPEKLSVGDLNLWDLSY